jgi:hypothetical protein
LFPKEYYKIGDKFRDVRVVRYPALSAGAPLYPQLSVGVPLGGGVLAVLDELARSISSRSPNAASVRAAMRFGWQVARRFAAGTTGGGPSAEDVQALTPDRDVAMVAEVMALAYMQLRGVLRYRATLKYLMKRWMAVVSRQSLYEIQGEMGPRLRGFFAGQADGIRGLFEAEFRAEVPGFDDEYRSTHGQPPGDLWELDFFHKRTREHISTVGRLFDEILRPADQGPRIGQGRFSVNPADSDPGLDRQCGSCPRGLRARSGCGSRPVTR